MAWIEAPALAKAAGQLQLPVAYDHRASRRLYTRTRKFFSPLDSCLTSAFDERIRGRDPGAVLTSCGASELLQGALDCGYAFTDELFKLSAVTQDTSGREVAREVILQECT